MSTDTHGITFCEKFCWLWKIHNGNTHPWTRNLCSKLQTPEKWDLKTHSEQSCCVILTVAHMQCRCTYPWLVYVARKNLCSLTEVLCYSASNPVTWSWSKYATDVRFLLRTATHPFQALLIGSYFKPFWPIKSSYREVLSTLKIY